MEASVLEKAEVYRAIQRDPFALARFLNFNPTPQQAALLEDIWAGHRRLAIKSGQGTGKTTVSALIATWRAIRRRNSRVIVTAPSMRQCKEVWMTELRQLIQNAPRSFRDLFHFTSQKCYIGARGRDDDSRPDWGIHCVTATNPVNAQGYHGDTLSFIVEEASGVPRPIVEQIEGTLSQPGGDFLHMQIGNPNTRDCAFYDSFHSKRADWKCHTFNSLESPRVDPEHCAYIRRNYGENSDVYRVRVLGEFPKMDPNAVMAMDDLEACTKTDPEEMAFLTDFKQIGNDIARFGSDESGLGRVRGNALLELKAFSKVEPEDVVAMAFVMQEQAGWTDEECYYVADADGMGQGVMSRYRKNGKRLLEFHSNGRPYARRMYANRMSEAWFTLAGLVKAHRCYLPNDPMLLAQLAGRLYGLDNNGLIKIEKKEDYKKRTESDSPDRADTAVMAFYRKPTGLEAKYGGF